MKFARLLFLLLVGVCVYTVGVPFSLATGASFKISPSSGTYEVGGLVDVSFILDTGGESVNAVNADVTFPADKLQVVNPAASTSFISLWVTAPTYSNTDGTINFQGGLPNPGIKTSAGVISTVTFRVKAPGKATLRYATTSKALRNDGEGTNILTSTGTAEFQLNNAPPAGPVVSSPSHNDANHWYNNPQIQFTWDPIAGATGYSYSFDQNAKSIPPETPNTTTSSVSLKATADGVWYFHIRAKTNDIWGGVTDFAVQIDTTPPAAFTPKLDKNVISTVDSGTLRFLTTDAASGIDHYEVKEVSKQQASAGTLFVEANSPFIIPQQQDGEYEYIVRAFDRAGNTIDGSATLKVVAGGVPFYARVPLLRNPAVANTVLVILAVLLLATTGWILVRRLRIRSTFQHDLKVLEHDAQRKYVALQKEMDELRSAQAMFPQEPAPNTPPTQPPLPPHS